MTTQLNFHGALGDDIRSSWSHGPTPYCAVSARDHERNVEVTFFLTDEQAEALLEDLTAYGYKLNRPAA